MCDDPHSGALCICTNAIGQDRRVYITAKINTLVTAIYRAAPQDLQCYAPPFMSYFSYILKLFGISVMHFVKSFYGALSLFGSLAADSPFGKNLGETTAREPGPGKLACDLGCSSATGGVALPLSVRSLLCTQPM